MSVIRGYNVVLHRYTLFFRCLLCSLSNVDFGIDKELTIPNSLLLYI